VKATAKALPSSSGHSLGEVQLPEAVGNAENHAWRMRFLQKLSYEKVLVPKLQRPKKQETLIVFDWDDTLMCTNFLREAIEYGMYSETRQRETFRMLEPQVRKLLEKALALGRVIIITNAEVGWVETSAAEHMPGLLPLLQRIDVISARHKYGDMFPGDYSAWKAEAFMDVQRELDPGTVMNMVALGDAHYEIDAAQALRGTMEKCVVKTLQFCSNPTPKQLMKELSFVTKTLHKVVSSVHDRSHAVPFRRESSYCVGGA
jgi:hypothetical protein